MPPKFHFVILIGAVATPLIKMRLLLFVFATILLLSIVMAQPRYSSDYDGADTDQLEQELERFFLTDWIESGAKLVGKGISKAGGLVKDSFHAVGNVFG